MPTRSSSDGDRGPVTSLAVGGGGGGEENAARRAPSGTEDLKKRAKTFSYSFAVPLWSLLVAIFVQHHLLLDSVGKGKPADVDREIALLQTCVLSTVVTVGFAGTLLLVAEFLPDDDNNDPTRYHYLALKLLLHACGFLLKLTAFCLLLLIDPAGNAAMALFVLLAAALHVILFNKSRRSGYRSDANGYAAYAEELDRLIDFSKEMVSVAYGGLIGRVFDYFKNFTTDVHGAHLKVFDVLMFFTAVVGALALTLDALPPLLGVEPNQKPPVGALKCLNIASALTAMESALALSFGAVGEYAFLMVVPPLALAVWWLQMYFANEQRPRDAAGDSGARRGHGVPMSVTIPIMAFGVVFAVILNSKGGGGNNNTLITGGGVDLPKVLICVFSTVFIMGLGSKLLEHWPPGEPNLERAMRRMVQSNDVTMLAATLLLGALVCKTIWNFAWDDNGAGADGRSISPSPY